MLPINQAIWVRIVDRPRTELATLSKQRFLVMSFSATRLTIYFVLSAIEADLREFIKIYLDGQKNHDEILGTDVLQKALDRLKKDQDQSSDNPSLEEILYYTDFPDAFKTLNRHKELLPKSTARFFQEKTKLFEALGLIRNRIAHSRPLQFDDLPITLDGAQVLSESAEVPWENVKSALTRLQNDPSFVLGVQIPTFSDTGTDDHKHNLPTPDFDETGFLGSVDDSSDLDEAQNKLNGAQKHVGQFVVACRDRPELLHFVE